MNERDDSRKPAGDFASDEPLPPGVTEPVDVVQVRADEALVSALSASEDVQIDDPIDERLVGLLQSWRDDVRSEPERPLIDVGAATAALSSARRVSKPSRSSRPSKPASPFGPLATAAAVLVVAFIGLGLAAKSAEPGDALWNVTKVLYSDKARSVEAAVAVQAKLDEASKALETGNLAAAFIALQEARRTLLVVQPEDGRDELTTKADLLMAEASAEPSPPPALPSTTTTTATSTTETTTESAQPAVPTEVASPISTTSTTVVPTTDPPSTSVATPTTETAPGSEPAERSQGAPKAGNTPPARLKEKPAPR